MDDMNIFKKLCKKGISATLVAIILLIVGAAIVILFVIFAGQQTQVGFGNMMDKLNIIRHGG
jgi:hypothetical protein